MLVITPAAALVRAPADAANVAARRSARLFRS
jgi:hypothetical protein